MKSIFYIVLFFLFFSSRAISQPCPVFSGFTFTTQAELDAFPNNFPNCKDINGNVVIDTAITNLQSLNQIESISGDLFIENTIGLENLNGLENLTSVRDLVITNNSGLLSLEGLENLSIVEEDLRIVDNPKLPNLNGLTNLVSVVDDITIVRNDTLESLIGLENLSSVGYDIVISQNKFLKNLNGLTSINSVIGNLTISINPLLENLGGLENLNRVGSNLTVSGNDTLENLIGLESLDSIIYDLRIGDNSSLLNFVGLSNLNFVGHDFRLTGNSSLVNFEGLSNLEFIGNYFRVEGNNSLINFSGLDILNSVEGYLWVESNPSLMSFTGLSIFLSKLARIYVKNNDSLLDLTGLENIDTLGGINLQDNELIINLHGLENIKYFDEIVRIERNNSLTSLEGLNNIKSESDYLYIEANPILSNITALANLDSIGGWFKITDNDNLINLSGLENLITVGGRFFISENDQLLEIGGLNSLINVGELFTISGNSSLVKLNGLKKLSEINGNLSISSNDNLVTIEGLDSLKLIGGIFRINNNTSLKNVNGLEKLENIPDLRIYGNDVISDISSLSNIDISNITKLNIYNNLDLSFCNLPNFCNYLANGGEYYIQNNSNGCNDLNQIISNCADSLAKIQLNIFYDTNQNKIKDSSEQYMPLASVSVSPNNEIFYSNSNFGGYAFLDDGNYEIELNQNLLPEWNLITDSLSYHINIDSTVICDTVSFGMFPISQTSDIVSLINGPRARCGEYKVFEAHAKNLGTTIVNGTLWLEVDSKIDSTNFIDIPDTIVAPNLYGWHFENLFPGFTFSPKIDLKVPAPPNVMIGDSLYFNSFVEYSDTNGMATSSVFEYATEIRCSFDPNDKLVNPSRNNNYTLFEEDLIYTIRFQNTGNDEAYDIIIRDTLDTNLDASTFRVLTSSHPDKLITSLDENQYLTFNFENIYLPDSTSDFEGSQGYVSYMISPNEGLPEETNITNTASIYFDFNPPIVTNTTESLMVSELPTSTFNLGKDNMRIEIFPNPVSDFVFIKKESLEELTYQILDVNGRIITTGILESEINNIDFTKMEKGIYFIKIQDKNTQEFIVDKIVK